MRLQDNSVLVRSTADARSFRDGAARLIASHPVLHSVLATTLDHAIATPEDYPGARWYWATRGNGRWLAVAMHTPPRPFHLVTSDPVLARAFAYRMREQQVAVDAVSGLVPGALAFAESWVDLGGAAAITVARREGLYDLPGPVTRPKGVPGTTRPATEADLPLLDIWAEGYSRDNHQPAPGADAMAPWLAKGGLRVHEVDGVPVSMVYASRPHGGVSRLSWVYTPDEHRGHGYASAAVAAAATEQRAHGLRVLLYTDLDNQPATALYVRAGFRRIGDAAVLSLLDQEPVVSFGTNPMRKPRARLRPRHETQQERETRRRRAQLAQMIARARTGNLPMPSAMPIPGAPRIPARRSHDGAGRPELGAPDQ